MPGRIALLGVLCLMVTACGGGGELAVPSTDATSPSVKITAVPPGAECANGGSLVTSPGTSTTQYVCNGSGGQNALVQSSSLPVGNVNCPQGGARVQMGQDANGNLILDPAEVSLTRYVCETGRPANGSAGPDSLVVITTAPAATDCPSGREKVASGVDINGDGLLQPAEVTNSSYVCHRSSGIGALITTQALGTGDSNCAYGGTRVISGADNDGSGSLLNADGSVNVNNATKTSYVCRGLTGASAAAGSELLVSSVAIAAGNVNCPRGGTEVVTGRNTDGTGALINADASLSVANGLNATYMCSGNKDPALVNVTGATQQMASNAGYTAANDTAQVVLTLPAKPQTGDVVRIEGSGLGGWRLAQNEGQTIDLQGLAVQASTVATVSGPSGSLSGGASDSIALIFLGDGKYGVKSSSGSGFVASDSGPASPPPIGPGNSPSDPVDNLPSFTFGELTKTFGDGSFQLNPPVPGSAFGYASSNPAVAQISGNTVVIVGAGTTTLTATLLATGQSSAATLTVNKAQAGLQLPAVTIKALTRESPSPYPHFQLQPTTKSDGALTYALSNVVASGAPALVPPGSDAASLDSQNGLTYIQPGYLPGTGTITVTQAATANYEGATVSTALVIQKGETVVQIDDKYLHVAGTDWRMIPIAVTQEVLWNTSSDLRAGVATLDDPTIADVKFSYNEYAEAVITFVPKTAGSTLLTITVTESGNLGAATVIVPLSVDQTTTTQAAMNLITVSHSVQAPYSNDFYAQFYTFVPDRTPAVKLYICSTRPQRATFAFNVGPYMHRWGRTVTVTLSDGTSSYRLGDPLKDYSPTYNKYEGVVEYYFEFPAGAYAGEIKNYTLKSNISSWGDGTAFFVPAAELTYTVQTEAQPPIGPTNGQHPNNCILTQPV